MGSFLSYIREIFLTFWVPSSVKSLENAERKLLGRLDIPFEGTFVSIGGGEFVRTLRFCPRKINREEKTPIVLLHGLAGGLCWWTDNFAALSEDREVFAIDLPGFGRSSRPDFHNDTHWLTCETRIVAYLEEWRQAVGLEKFMLLGHSFGGYIATAYTIKHPENVVHLVLNDPWGFSLLPFGLVDRHPDIKFNSDNLPLVIHFINFLLNAFSLLAPIRASGPIGPMLVKLARYDSRKRLSNLWREDAMFDYLYHSNALTPSGEVAFKNLNLFYFWAKNPMIKRIMELDRDTDMSVLYGSKSFLDHRVAYEIKCLRETSRVDVYIVKDAGHDIHVDNPPGFNNVMREIFEKHEEYYSSKRITKPQVGKFHFTDLSQG